MTQKGSPRLTQVEAGFAPILIVLLIAIAVGGFLVYQNQPKPTPPPQTVQPSPTQDETANWKTYTIPNILTFKYPPNYVIKSPLPGVVVVADKENDFGPAQTSITIDTRMTGIAANYNEAVRSIKGNIEQFPNGVKTTHETDITLYRVNQKMKYTSIYYKYKEGAIMVIYGDDKVGSRRYGQILSTFKFLP